MVVLESTKCRTAFYQSISDKRKFSATGDVGSDRLGVDPRVGNDYCWKAVDALLPAVQFSIGYLVGGCRRNSGEHTYRAKIRLITGTYRGTFTVIGSRADLSTGSVRIRTINMMASVALTVMPFMRQVQY